ncbi:MAG: divergent PAP2 family protein [Kiritimatiellae bacterium]|nr:divergent PAP2 family protein [Kiritimatiellia bacterium]MBR4611456.1 divergent PAP2 family protein [Kiritimatiellia bacterium]
MTPHVVHIDFWAVCKSLWFWSAFVGWMVAGFIKMAISFVETRRFNLSCLVSTGRMPSAHSALVSALATTIGMTEGFDTPIFALAICFAAITLFDAAGVRYAASQQAMLLNQITEELFSEHTFNVPRLKELLGHTRKEVLAGMVTGVVSGVAVVKILW